MRSRVQKWGHSLALRIPKAFAVEARLEENTVVDISFADGQIVVVKPVVAREWTLDGLLAGITEENTHAEVDTGGAIGKESW